MIIKLSARSRHQVVTANSASTPPPPSATAPAAPTTHHHPRALRGTISAENGSTWTLNTVKGATYTINITPTTTFGTKKAPATAQSFPIGAEVVVAGEHSGTTITATRIATPARHAS
ncbi:MAG: hypothetical protein M3Y48_07680 [Actinomycetota bacterium]|nr:hypothetical protein [Actinomycetota bacterium]